MKRIILTALLLLIALPALGQQPPNFPELDPGRRSAIIDSLVAALDTVYVFPEVATEMGTSVKRKLADGEYDDIADVADFTAQLTEDFQAVSHDLHLRVQVELPPSAEEEEDPAIAQERQRRFDRFRNHNFQEAVRLPGNVGYLKFDGFGRSPEAMATAVAAMNFLSNSDALIIDLTENGGGSPSMIQLLTTYLVHERTHLNSFYVRATDDMRQFWTLPYAPGPSMADIPVYVLTSRRTFSAAEEFTYNLKNLERATIVGETTGGGAHPVNGHFFAFPEYHITMSLPFGRAINPITGTNWEGTGIEPHLACSKAEAKDTAYLNALEALENDAEDPMQKRALAWTREGLAATVNPAPLNREVLDSFVGDYGPRHIKLEGETLVYQRDDRDPYPMIAMGEDRFMFADLDYFRIQFERNGDGKVVRLVGQYDNGRSDANDRDK
jgi:hypothetical protein